LKAPDIAIVFIGYYNRCHFGPVDLCPCGSVFLASVDDGSCRIVEDSESRQSLYRPRLEGYLLALRRFFYFIGSTVVIIALNKAYSIT